MIKRTILLDKELEYNGYIYLGEYSLDKGENFFKPKEYAKKFCRNGVEEVLYKTRIQPSSSARLIKIFVKVKV